MQVTHSISGPFAVELQTLEAGELFRFLSNHSTWIRGLQHKENTTIVCIRLHDGETQFLAACGNVVKIKQLHPLAVADA